MRTARTRRVLTAAMAVIACMSLTLVAFAAGGEAPASNLYGTFWALVPPVVAIVLALITKEAYSSLFIGILAGGLLYSNFSFEGTVTHAFNDGIVASLSDGYNVGILIFLVISLAGNALNFALNLLGCYVHDLRLQCLEYFGKFYQDGGRPFRPLDLNTKYYEVVK